MEKSDKNFNINISSSTIIKAIVIFVLAFLLYKMMDLVLVVLTAVVIASAVEPITKWSARYKIKRIFSVLLTYIVIVLVFAGLLYFFIPPVLEEASGLLSEAPKYLDSLTLWNPLNDSKIADTSKVASGLSQGLTEGKGILGGLSDGTLKPSALGDLINQFQSLAVNTSDGLIKIASGIFGGALSFVLMIVLSFYLAVQENGVEKFLKIITPIKNEAYIVDLWKRSQRKIGYWMQGQLLLGVLVGILVYLGLMILGVKNALILAVLAGVLEIIPLFGPILAAIPAILSGFLGGGVTMGLLVLGLFVIIQQFENHLIYPLVVKKVVGISPIIVILSLIIGAKLAGFLGIILSVPITSAIMEFIDDVQRDKTTESNKLHV
ncbi:MAG: AI-2E family transporter [Candidatus Paceibacterota bacterium]